MRPQTCLRRRQFMVVHAALKRGGTDARLVEPVTLTHGFWHLGRFARTDREQADQTLALAREDGCTHPGPGSGGRS